MSPWSSMKHRLQNGKAMPPVVRRLSAAEAQGMDPQNRVLLEQAALALGDAAPATGPLQDTPTGVYIGCMYQVFDSTKGNLPPSALSRHLCHLTNCKYGTV